MAGGQPRQSDSPYAAFVAGAVVATAVAGTVGLSALAVVIGVVDWAEYRDRLSTETPVAAAATVVVLACLLVCCALTREQLGLYFGVLGVAFLAQAVRFVVLTNPAPSTLFRRGYPSLVGLSIVCSALADGLPQFRWVTLVLLASVYAFRKLYIRW